MIALIRKVDGRFEPCNQIEQVGIDFPNPAGQCALQLVEGGTRLNRCHRVNQIRDGFGLRQIDPSIEERAKRELAWLGESCALGHGGPDDGPQNHRTAVRAQLHHVLSRVRARPWEVRRNDVVDRFRRSQ